MYSLFGKIFFALTTLSLCAAPARAGEELAPLWASAIQALHANATSDAVRLFDRWIDTAEKLGVHSSEAHYNLGLAHWSAKEPGKAVYQLLESARLKSSPLSSIKTIGMLEGIEHEVGIKDGVSDSFSFRLYFLLNRDWIVACLSLSFWLVVAAIVGWWLKGRVAHQLQGLCVGTAAFFTAVAVIGAVNRHYFCRLAVLDAGGIATIPLFRTPQEKEDEKLVDLPSGTIVDIGPTEATFVAITRPVAGWVPAGSVKELTRE